MQFSFNLFPGGADKALTMSYDDGQVFDIRLAEIFDRYDIKATFHLNSGRFGTPGFLTEEDVKKHLSRHEISVHSVSHPYLERIPSPLAAEEIVSDKAALERLCGYPVRGMSYPYGTYSQPLKEQLRSLGMEYSRTIVATHAFHLPQDFMEWHPTAHHNMDIAGLWQKFINPMPYYSFLRVMYVWGHSFEFDRENNWNLIEDFCKETGGRSDIWYATNIDIMDYANAVRSLKFSADKHMIQNISMLDVWLTVNGEAVCVKSGEILRFK